MTKRKFPIGSRHNNLIKAISKNEFKNMTPKDIARAVGLTYEEVTSVLSTEEYLQDKDKQRRVDGMWLDVGSQIYALDEQIDALKIKIAELTEAAEIYEKEVYGD